MEIIMRIQVYLISQMNMDYEENGGKKALIANPKHHCHAPQCGEHDCSATKKKNRDYYKYPNLYHFMDAL